MTVAQHSGSTETRGWLSALIVLVIFLTAQVALLSLIIISSSWPAEVEVELIVAQELLWLVLPVV